MGADVTHPSPFENSHSIASVTGSMDKTGARYAGAARPQTSRVETILDIGEMCKQILRSFRKNTNHKPERMLFYRDGVSEGQFDMVRNVEVRAEWSRDSLFHFY